LNLHIKLITWVVPLNSATFTVSRVSTYGFVNVSLGNLMISLGNLVTSAHEGWYWTVAYAINNAAYSEEAEFQISPGGWFSTGLEIPNDYWRCIRGEPKQAFDENYGTYVRCGAMTADNDIMESTHSLGISIYRICQISLAYRKPPMHQAD
jgi:hypothetical protein